MGTSPQPVASLLQLAQSDQVLPGTIVDDGIHQDLQGILAGEQMDDLKGTLDDVHDHELFVIVFLSIIVELVSVHNRATLLAEVHGHIATYTVVRFLASFSFTDM